MDFVFEKSIDFYGIFELIYTKKWSTLYLFKIILQYISSWWRCSNSRAINFHSFLDFLLPILHTSILNVNDFFDFQPWNFFYHDFMTLWSTVLQIIIKKVQKNTQEVQVILGQISVITELYCLKYTYSEFINAHCTKCTTMG